MDEELTSVSLYQLAHSRAGDKGDTVNLSLIAYRPEHFSFLVEQVTEAAVSQWFRHRAPTSVKRHVLPKLGAMNFVLEHALDGGVNESLNLDGHGKSLSFLLLQMRIQLPKHLVPKAGGTKGNRTR
ncbi:MAG TPA: hypothetical protein VLD18_08430 [Verrucomicrobiae bacterium]|nr:hypothetical protein [Verrucomicrobiae bacterium]